jgi:putative flippase GtrA
MRFTEIIDLMHRRQFSKFVLVGAVGFCIDAGLLTLLMQLGWEILPARAISFMSAATGTWGLNRVWTFKYKECFELHKEYIFYIATQVIGACINLSVFFVLIEVYPMLTSIPLIPLAFGAVVSLVFNYTVSKVYVFKGQSDESN